MKRTSHDGAWYGDNNNTTQGRLEGEHQPLTGKKNYAPTIKQLMKTLKMISVNGTSDSCRS